jgi:ubiquitin carboxyl-terminal hydrolase 4/11/15
LVSYDEIINGKPPGKYFGKLTLEKINHDLEDNQVMKCFKYFPLRDHAWNTFMKEGLIEN